MDSRLTVVQVTGAFAGYRLYWDQSDFRFVASMPFESEDKAIAYGIKRFGVVAESSDR